MSVYIYIYIYIRGLDYLVHFRDPNTGLHYVGKFYTPHCFPLFVFDYRSSSL